MKIFIALFITVLIFNDCISQDTKFRNYKYTWKEVIPEKLSVDKKYSGEDAVILKEKCIYNAGGNLVPVYSALFFAGNYYFSGDVNSEASPVIQKHYRIKFLTQAGIENHGSVILPESFDYQSDMYSVPREKHHVIYRPKGDFNTMRYFAARIIKSDGRIIPAIIDETIQTEISRYNQIDEKYYNWIFKIKNLEPGDEAEIDYSYAGTFNIDASQRIFFDGKIPKQDMEFMFRYPADKQYIIFQKNGALPYDSVMVTKSQPKSTEYYYHFKNLDGGIDEVGSRHYLKLPHLVYYFHRMDFGYSDGRGFITKKLPYNWKYSLLSLVDYRSDNLKFRLARPDRTTQALNDLAQQIRRTSIDTSAAALLSAFHREITDNYEYENDKAYQAGDDQKLERLFKFIDQKKLRRISRYRYYDEFMIRVDRPYFHVLFFDKRIHTIDPVYKEDMTSRRMAIGIIADEGALYFYPKTGRYGYQSNELPFYYEDITALLIPQLEKTEKQYDPLPDVPIYNANTPTSETKDNIRITSGKITVSPDSMKVMIKLKINLAGQYSTLTRGFYQYGEKDTTINPLYFVKVSAAADSPQTVRAACSAVAPAFPFNTIINEEFAANNHLKISGNTIHFKLNGLFNNVTDPDFDSGKRKLDYYPDFSGRDIHRYYFEFNRTVILKNAEALQKNIHNSFGDYTVSVKQVNEQSLMIETENATNGSPVEAKYAADVQNIFNAISDLNNSDIIAEF
jgi:hypothetical protein